MDKKLRNLQRLSGTDPEAKERYIRALERIVGVGDDSELITQKCLTKSCPNRADQGYGLYIITQPSKPGEAPYTWDNAVGPLFVCSPCYQHLKIWRDTPSYDYSDVPLRSNSVYNLRLPSPFEV